MFKIQFRTPPAPHAPAVMQLLLTVAPHRAQSTQGLALGHLPPALVMPETLATPATATTEPTGAPAGLMTPLRRRTATSVLPNLLAHFGHQVGLGLLGEAADHRMIQTVVVVVGVVVVAAAEVLMEVLMEIPTLTLPTRSASGLLVTKCRLVNSLTPQPLSAGGTT